jgi:hypothetical protein
MRNKPLQKYKLKPVSETPLKISGITAPRNVNDAKRILSKLISEFIKGSIEDSRAKTLCYLLSAFVNITRETDFESRLSELEKIIEGERK